MAKKISQLDSVTSIAGTELVEVSQSGVSKSATVDQLNTSDTNTLTSTSGASREQDNRLHERIDILDPSGPASVSAASVEQDQRLLERINLIDPDEDGIQKDIDYSIHNLTLPASAGSEDILSVSGASREYTNMSITSVSGASLEGDRTLSDRIDNITLEFDDDRISDGTNDNRALVRSDNNSFTVSAGGNLVISAGAPGVNLYEYGGSSITFLTESPSLGPETTVTYEWNSLDYTEPVNYGGHGSYNIYTNDPANAVDGSTGTYARFNPGRYLVFDGNECAGTDLGPIAKVEYRVHYSGQDQYVAPYFGDLSTPGTEELLPSDYSTPATSEWFDVTNDGAGPGSGNWSWADVQNLKLVIFANTSPMGPRAWIYLTEIRVTYNTEGPLEPAKNQKFTRDGVEFHKHVDFLSTSNLSAAAFASTRALSDSIIQGRDRIVADGGRAKALVNSDTFTVSAGSMQRTANLVISAGTPGVNFYAPYDYIQPGPDITRDYYFGNVEPTEPADYGYGSYNLFNNTSSATLSAGSADFVNPNNRYLPMTSLGGGGVIDDDTYTITKVEVRAHVDESGSLYYKMAYGSTYPFTPYGDTHQFTHDGWSEWLDITNDTNAPSEWKYDPDLNTNFRMIIWSQSVGSAESVEWTEVRVTYNEPSTETAVSEVQKLKRDRIETYHQGSLAHQTRENGIKVGSSNTGDIFVGKEVANLNDLVLSSTNDIWVSAGQATGEGVYIPSHVAVGNNVTNGMDYGGIIHIPFQVSDSGGSGLDYYYGLMLNFESRTQNAGFNTIYGINLSLDNHSSIAQISGDMAGININSGVNNEGFTINGENRLMGAQIASSITGDNSSVPEQIAAEIRTFSTGVNAVIGNTVAGRFEVLYGSSQDSIVSGGGYGVWIKTPAGGVVAATTANLYGLYIEDQSGEANWQDKYNIYSVGANSTNYFEGNVTVNGNFNSDIIKSVPDAGTTSTHIITPRSLLVSGSGGNSNILDMEIHLPDGNQWRFWAATGSSYFDSNGHLNFRTDVAGSYQTGLSVRDSGNGVWLYYQNSDVLQTITDGIQLLNSDNQSGEITIGRESAIDGDLMITSPNSIHLSAANVYQDGISLIDTLYNSGSTLQWRNIGAGQAELNNTDGSSFVIRQAGQTYLTLASTELQIPVPTRLFHNEGITHDVLTTRRGGVTLFNQYNTEADIFVGTDVANLNNLVLSSPNSIHLSGGTDQTIDLNTGGITGLEVSGGTLLAPNIKSGPSQVGAGAVANEVWKTASHATLPDNVLMIGV